MATSKRSDESDSAQVPPTRATGLESATGTAIRENERDDIPQGEDRGSKIEIEGGEPEADALEGAEPRGAQAEPARFTSNGQIPHNTVPSPSGAVPVGAVATSVEDARARVEEAQRSHDEAYANRGGANQRISEATVGRLGRAELLAIAQTRGYEGMNDLAGTRRTRTDFLKAQDEDESIEDQLAAGGSRAKSGSAKKSSAKKSK